VSGSLQRTRRPRVRSGRSLCSLGSPLNAEAFGDARHALNLFANIQRLVSTSQAAALAPMVSPRSSRRR
jgi:hypothetical protein